ncbi:hypothetical protein GCM10025875_34490 [Litorihabitans aurantiacus]|uniref:Uncharacterized protein n=1 Tax=Litorihabitans aurantiacus TaxID=1930061 RepID=A0AA37XI56_9MICO|nr:hypothetical protein [Litorihabitans aurantiacus]GMA33457.1 hypothetical protein GCM10025875_34490 [Litorihabitans aurantiacus]
MSAAGDGERDAPTHDPRVPALAMLLDDAATARWLREAGLEVGDGGAGDGGVDVGGAGDGARVRYLRHKPGTSVQAWVEVAAPDGGPVRHAIVLGTAAGGGAKRSKLARSAARRGTWAVSGADDARIEDAVADDARAEAARTDDARAAGADGTRAIAVGHAADRALPALAPVLRTGVVTLRHNPGRRWVGRSATGELVKVSAPGREATAAHGARVLAAHGVPTPPVLESGGGLLRLDFWPGTTLEGRLVEPDLEMCGRLVARLHAIPVAALDRDDAPIPAPGGASSPTETSRRTRCSGARTASSRCSTSTGSRSPRPRATSAASRGTSSRGCRPPTSRRIRPSSPPARGGSSAPCSRGTGPPGASSRRTTS